VDGTLPQNNGVYTVEYASDKALRVFRSKNPADATLTINAFSTLILGGGESTDTVDFTDWRDGVSIHNPQAAFGDVFYQKPLFIMDTF
jgi:hypothetical protein